MKKWRNKITGEISEFMIHKRIEDSEDGNPVYAPFDGHIDDWEDYEEPKEYWYINSDSAIYATDCGKYPDSDLLREEIGNYFETREEAEKAVEKLKAWKRLKDGGITFKNWTINQTGTIDCFATWGDNIPPSRKNPTLLEDLDLLFGGEE